MRTERNDSGLIACFMMVFPTLFFAYQIIVRNMPSLLAEEIMQQLDISAGLFGSLSVAYYVGYALSNIPMAVLMEKYEPRYVISISSCVCGLLLFVFHSVSSVYVAMCVRFIIGVASSVGFISISKVALQWFSKNNYGIALSSCVTLGLLGAVFSGGPLDTLIGYYGANNMVTIISFAAFIVGGLILLFLRTPKEQVIPSNVSINLSQVGQVLCSVAVLLIGLGSLLMMGFDVGFSDLWGVTYFSNSFSMSKNEAASLISWGFAGVVIGAPLVTLIGKMLGESNVIVVSAVVSALLFYLLILSDDGFNFYVFSVTMFTLGILSSTKILVFPICARVVEPAVAAVALALLNCVFMSGGIFYHAVIGWLLDYFWTGELRGYQRYYDSDAFYMSFLVIPIGCLLGGILVPLVERVSLRKKG